MKSALTLALCLGALVTNAGAQQQNLLEQYAERDVMIPMRDGVKLHTKIFAPKKPTGAAAVPDAAHAVRHRRVRAAR